MASPLGGAAFPPWLANIQPPRAEPTALNVVGNR